MHTFNIPKKNFNPQSYTRFIKSLQKIFPGTPGVSQTRKPVRLAGYKITGVKYFVATDRYDLTAEQIATVYKLR